MLQWKASFSSPTSSSSSIFRLNFNSILLYLGGKGSLFFAKYWSIRGKVGHFQANKRWKTLLPKHLSIISKGNAAFFEIVPTTLITLEQNPLSYGKPIVVNLDCLLLFPSSNFAGRTTNGRTLDVIRAASFISLVLQCSLQRAATSIIELLLLCYPHFK